MKNLKQTPTRRDLRSTANALNELNPSYEDFFTTSIRSNTITFLGYYVDGIVGKYEDLGFKFTKNSDENSEFYVGYAYYDEIQIDITFIRKIKND